MSQGINHQHRPDRVSQSRVEALNIGSPEGHQKFKPAEHRKTSLATAMSAIKAGKGTLDQVVNHWRDISHRTRGIESKPFFAIPIDFRGSSLSGLDTEVTQFQQKEWGSEKEFIDGLKALRDHAKTHQQQSGKRKVSTQLLIDKCNEALARSIAKEPVTRALLLDDLQQHHGQLSQHLSRMSLTINEADTRATSTDLAEEIFKKVCEQTVSLTEGLQLMKTTCTNDVYLQTAASLICELSNGDVRTLAQILAAQKSHIDTQIIQEVTLSFVRDNYMEQINNAVSQLPTIFKNSPSTSLMLSKSLKGMIQHGSLDEAIRNTPRFFGATGPVSDAQLASLKESPEQATEFAARMLSHPEEFVDTFQQLCDEPSIGLPILKGHIQSTILQKAPTIGHSVKFLQQLEIAQFNMIDALNTEKASVKAQLKAPELTEADRNTLTEKKEALSKQLNSLERGEFQDAIGTIDDTILSDINQLNTKSYAERTALMPAIIARTGVSDIIQKTMIDGCLAMLDRSTKLVDIDSDIHTTNRALFEAHSTTHFRLAQNLTASLYSINLQHGNGTIQYGKSTLPNHQAYAILEQLIQCDPSINDPDATLLALKTTCFPSDDDQAFSKASLATFLSTLPDASTTLKTLELLSSKYFNAMTHHMVFDFMDDLPNLPTENNTCRSITLSTTATGVTLACRSEFNAMNLELEETAASFTTQQTMHYEFGHELTTQFQLGECQLSEALTTKASLEKTITEWHGELKTPSKKPPLSSLLAAHLPTAETNYQQLINGMAASSKPTTEHNIELLNTLLTQIDGAPKSIRFQCLSQIESLAHTLQGQLTELKSNGQYRGINLKYLFTSKSIWNTQTFDAYKEQLNRILERIHDLRYAGTKLEKSQDQQYTIIEGAQGNRYELLTHLSEREADELGIAHFLTEKYSYKQHQVENVIQVGRGGAKIIRLARNMSTGEIVIVGKTKFTDESDPRIADFFTEIENHLGLTKTSVVQLQDQALIEFKDGQQKGYTFMKLGKASGDQLIANLNAADMPPNDKETQTSQVCIDLIKGVAEFEARGFIHGDIKPENFVIDSENHAHWIDFGTGQPLELMQQKNHYHQINVDRTSRYVPRDLTPFGTDQFHPTESIAKKDAWALGLTLYQVWANTMPFGIAQCYLEDDISTKIQANALDTTIIPEPHRTVIHGLLTTAPCDRWSATQALKHLAPRLAQTIHPQSSNEGKNGRYLE